MIRIKPWSLNANLKYSFKHIHTSLSGDSVKRSIQHGLLRKSFAYVEKDGEHTQILERKGPTYLQVASDHSSLKV